MSLDRSRTVFFCGIGGSGMMPLALILQAQGYTVSGSDRAFDQGKTPDKFQKIQDAGVCMCAQDGSGITSDVGVLVVSSAIEVSIPDVKMAQDNGIIIRKRADVLSEVFGLSDCSVGVSGTSGKTTVTGMIATVLEENDYNPTVMNGGSVRNLEETGASPFGSLLVGDGDYFVSEMDESDGSIELFSPDISVLNNIELDHTSLEQLFVYFQGFLDRAKKGAVVNLDNTNVSKLSMPKNTLSYGIDHPNAVIKATDLNPRKDGVSFRVEGKNVRLQVPGRHNVSNALAALCVAKHIGMSLDDAIRGLESFTGIRRRLETLGCTSDDVTVIDDFAHNPDKIAASLATLKEFDGRIIVMFQPHGFAPLRMMGKEMAEVFARYMSADDILCIPEVYYAGGTVDRCVTAKDFVSMIQNAGVRHSHYFENREVIAPFIEDNVRSGDRVVIMGARDDTLTDFAKSFL